jgi:hypothetical protein
VTALVLAPDEPDLRKHVVAINQYAQGRSNAGATFTCATGAGTTRVTDVNVSPTSSIAVCPASPAAAAEMASGSFFIDKAAIRAGSFDVSHTNAATAGRTFHYVIQG